MKDKNKVYSECMCVLAELQHGVDEALENYLKGQLSAYVSILDEEIDDDFMEQIEEFI